MRSCWVDRKLYKKKNEKENFFLIQIYRDIVVIIKNPFVSSTIVVLILVIVFFRILVIAEEMSL